MQMNAGVGESPSPALSSRRTAEPGTLEQPKKRQRSYPLAAKNRAIAHPKSFVQLFFAQDDPKQENKPTRILTVGLTNDYVATAQTTD